MAGLAYQFFMNIDKKFTLAYRCKLFWITFITLEILFARFGIRPVYAATTLHTSGTIDAVALFFACLTIWSMVLSLKRAPAKKIIDHASFLYWFGKAPCGRNDYIL